MSSSSSSCSRRAVARAAESIVARMPESPWRDACRALVDGDEARAADTLASMGTERLAADLRLRAARGAGRGRADWARRKRSSGSHARFYRKVGATAYLAEADAIVAAAS